LSLYAIYQVARVSVPAFLESFVRDLPRDKVDRQLEGLGRNIIRKARIKLTVEGLDRVPADRAFVYMSNHQSHLDVPLLYATVPARWLRMVAKKELFRVPIWGTAMRSAGIIELDRQSREKAIASLGTAAEQIRSGVSIWIAPEGHRSRTGQLGPLKKGGFHLATGTNTPIVPIAISGSFNILPPKSLAMHHDVPVRIVFGDPIEVEGKSIEELMAEVEAFFVENVSTQAV
jgi:1-acyl-sn-glycerol-3-phosphate acyltransferase